MSNFRTVFTNLAALTITVSSTTPQAFDLNAIPPDVNPAKLPCRILLPFGAEAEQGHAFTFTEFLNSQAAEATWHITDLCLWATVGAGRGLQSYAATLASYAAAYLEVIRTNWQIAAYCQIVGATFGIGAFEYPGGSGQYYFGVECKVEVQELFPQ